MSDKRVLTIGILAHVDAGKTSITESLLHHSGTTTSLGSVDKGSAITDGLSMEKSRGISIKASSVNFSWDNCIFQLVDTPGHIDFAAEVDRSLSILDGVILVVSAKEGIQAHTLNLWESLIERKLPVIIFHRIYLAYVLDWTTLEKCNSSHCVGTVGDDVANSISGFNIYLYWHLSI